MAAERVFGLKPAGMFYVGLKGGPEYAGWSQDRLMAVRTAAGESTGAGRRKRAAHRAAREIRAGRVEVAPVDPANCRFCDAADVCRVTAGAGRRGKAEARDRAAKPKSPTPPTQLDAIDIAQRTKDACVVAGPGSGKTTVLVEYFARLVEAGVRSAAHSGHHVHGKSRRKHAREVGAGVPGDRRPSVPRWSGRGSPRCTGFARACCAKNAVSPGIDPEFTSADERDALRMQHECYAARHGGPVRKDAARTARADSRAIVARFRGNFRSRLRRHARRGTRVVDWLRLPVPEAALNPVTAPKLRRCANPCAASACSPGTYAEASIWTKPWKRRSAYCSRRHAARTPWRAIEAFHLNLTKCKRGTAALRSG